MCLVGVKIPEKVYNERIRKARKGKAKGKELIAEEIERLKWILIITNVEEEILDAETICECYRVKWQIMPISALLALCRFFINADISFENMYYQHIKSKLSA